jgi:hypothetical protein
MQSFQRWGADFAGPKGYIVAPGSSQFGHRFGGKSWTVTNREPGILDPTLVLTLDLTDPALASLLDMGDELPLCTHLRTNIWEFDQRYLIDPVAREVVMIEGRVEDHIVTDISIALPSPLPESRVSLRDMRPDEYPVDYETYSKVTDDFIGGEGVIRVLGPTLWLQDVQIITCHCGSAMTFAASIGYENPSRPSRFISKPFFIGEAVLHFFVCAKCRELKVICESS